MAAPSWVQSSTGVVDTTGAYTDSLTGVTVGNLIIAHVNADGDTTGATQTLNSCSGVEALDGTDNTMTALTPQPMGNPTASYQYVWLGRATSTTVTFNATTDGQDIYMQLYEFSGWSNGSTLATTIENTTAGNYTNGLSTGTSCQDTAVDTTGADRLAINLGAVNDDNQAQFASFTGAFGGTWTLRGTPFGSGTGTDGSVFLQTGTVTSSGGTIDGGSFTMDSDAWGVIGFALLPATGGIGHTRTPADTLSLADSPTRQVDFTRTRTDNPTVADSFSRQVDSTRTFADSSALADLATPSHGIKRTLADTIALTDQATPTEGGGGVPHEQPVADTLTLSDARALTRTKANADSVALTDTRALTRTKTAADTVALTDQLARTTDTARTLADPLVVTDQATPARAISRTLADTLTLADQATPLEGGGGNELTRNINDTLALADTGTVAWNADRSTDDTIGLADSFSRQVDAVRSPQDTVALEDATQTSGSGAQVIGDSLTLTDQFSRQADYSRTPQDTVTLTDQATPVHTPGSVAHTRQINDTLAVADAVSKARGLARTDTLAVADALSRVREIARTVADALSLTDQATPTSEGVHTRTPADTLALADSFARQIDAERTPADPIALADTLTRTIQAQRLIADPIAVADTISLARELILTDTIALTDNAVPGAVRPATLTIIEITQPAVTFTSRPGVAVSVVAVPQPAAVIADTNGTGTAIGERSGADVAIVDTIP